MLAWIEYPTMLDSALSIGTLPVALLRTLRAQQRRSPFREVLRVLLSDSAISPSLGHAPIFVHDRACWGDAMGQMMVMTEYRTKPGKRDELFRAFERLLADKKVSGRDFVIWSTSAVEIDASFLFEYWSDAENFAYLVDAPWFVEYLTAVDALVSTSPTAKVTVPQFFAGA